MTPCYIIFCHRLSISPPFHLKILLIQSSSLPLIPFIVLSSLSSSSAPSWAGITKNTQTALEQQNVQLTGTKCSGLFFTLFLIFPNTVFDYWPFADIVQTFPTSLSVSIHRILLSTALWVQLRVWDSFFIVWCFLLLFFLALLCIYWSTVSFHRIIELLMLEKISKIF